MEFIFKEPICPNPTAPAWLGYFNIYLSAHTTNQTNSSSCVTLDMLAQTSLCTFITQMYAEHEAEVLKRLQTYNQSLILVKLMKYFDK